MGRNRKFKRPVIEIMVKKAVQEQAEKRVANTFKTIETVADNKRDMWELNRLLNFAFLSTSLKEITEFEKKNQVITDRDITEIVFEKALLLYCILSGNKYEELTASSYEEIFKKIPLINHIAKYKLEKFGSEIFREMGLEIIDITEKGIIIKEAERREWKN